MNSPAQKESQLRHSCHWQDGPRAVRVHLAQLQLFICPSPVLLQPDRLPTRARGPQTLPGQLQQSLLPALPFPPAIPVWQAGALRGRGGESCRQTENGVLGFLQPAARCLLWRFGGGQGSVGAAWRLWAGGKEAKVQLQAAGSELEQRGQARLHSSQPGHAEGVGPAEGCRAVLTKRSPVPQVCSDCTSCSSSSRCGSSEVTTSLTRPKQVMTACTHTQCRSGTLQSSQSLLLLFRLLCSYAVLPPSFPYVLRPVPSPFLFQAFSFLSSLPSPRLPPATAPCSAALLS